MTKEREKLIERGFRLAWDSLESHLYYTYAKLSKKSRKEGESYKFHKNCVKQYAEIIIILSKLY